MHIALVIKTLSWGSRPFKVEKVKIKQDGGINKQRKRRVSKTDVIIVMCLVLTMFMIGTFTFYGLEGGLERKLFLSRNSILIFPAENSFTTTK